jgi:RNA polymerase sigma-70 factor (ECF subfamily)
VAASETHRVVEGVWRIESARLIAGLTRVVRDVGLAEELAQDALVAALEQWPRDGVPNNPGAWLMTAAKRRGIDRIRHAAMRERKHDALTYELDAGRHTPDPDAALDDQIGDDLLRLIFIACHPVLSTDARVALTLRLLGGLSTDEIARAFLVPEPTIAQRIVRAKKTLAKANVPFEVPVGEELAERLSSVLEVVYLIFNEGYTASSGNQWTRPLLVEEALRLVRVLQGLAPTEPEVHGLAALLEIQASRLRARVGPQGEVIVLADQNRALWDHVLVHRGLGALGRARSLRQPPGAYVVQAEIAACHARAVSVEETDWPQIQAWYDVLETLIPSPVISLNRAVVVSRTQGPAAALEIVDGLRSHPLMATYHLLPALRADLLIQLGRTGEAAQELELALALTNNDKERDYLIKQRDKLFSQG